MNTPLTRTTVAVLLAASTFACTRASIADKEAFSATKADVAPCTASQLSDSSHGMALVKAQRDFLAANHYCLASVPEYNDAQRLSGAGGSGYGSIAHVYVYGTVATLDDHTDFDNAYIEVASVFVEGSDVPGPYNALHLQAGSNCVYLTHDHSGGGQARWRGRIAPPASDNRCTGGSGGKVDAGSEQWSTDPNDYPAVARWVEGPGRVPLLGVKCGNEWCNIGPGNAANPPHDGQVGAGTTKAWKVRGWYDDQTLSVPGVPIPVPSGPKLSIVPTDDLASKNAADFLNTWVPVAHVLVPAGTDLANKYGTGFHFREGVNTLHIQHYSQGGQDYWQAKVTNGAYSATYKKRITPEDHTRHGAPVPGTARWKWSETDEEIWVRCGVGCCTVQPD